MKLQPQSFLRFLAWIVLASLAMHFVTSYKLDSDKSTQFIFDRLSKDKGLYLKIGEMEKIKIIKKVSVSKTEKSEPHRIYTIIAYGTKAKARIVIKIEVPKNYVGRESITVISVSEMQ